MVSAYKKQVTVRECYNPLVHLGGLGSLLDLFGGRAELAIPSGPGLRIHMHK